MIKWLWMVTQSVYLGIKHFNKLTLITSVDITDISATAVAISFTKWMEDS